MQEQPTMKCTIVDLDPGATPETAAAALAEEITGAPGESQVAFRGATRYVPRLVRTKARHPGRMVEIRGEATYLVTGGFGGIGREVLSWLADKGARNFAVVGRSPVAADPPDVLDDLEKRGVETRYFQGDVSDARFVREMFDAIDGSMPPLRGVIHAAGVLADGILGHQTRERFRTVLAPKVQGGWNLHLQTRGREMDFFVLFSSAASVLGSPGQSNYAAANAFLDGMAWARRAEGLHAVSINWGPWAGSGMAGTQGDRDRLRRSESGIGSIPPPEGVRILGMLLAAPSPQVVVLPVDWYRFGRAARQPDPFLIELLPIPTDTLKGIQTDRRQWRQLVLERDPEDRLPVVLEALREFAARVLRIPASSIDTEKPLGEFGLDSLMATELRGISEAELGVSLPLVDILSGRPLSYLSLSVAKAFDGSATDAGKHWTENGRHPRSKPISADEAESLLEKLPEFSDQEVTEVLEKFLASKQGVS